MAIAINTTPSTVSTLEALWTIIQSQKKSVQKALAKRLNESIEAEKNSKFKMTEEEYYAMIDRSLASTKDSDLITMGDNESGMEFINRIITKNN